MHLNFSNNLITMSTFKLIIKVIASIVLLAATFFLQLILVTSCIKLLIDSIPLTSETTIDMIISSGILYYLFDSAFTKLLKEND